MKRTHIQKKRITYSTVPKSSPCCKWCLNVLWIPPTWNLTNSSLQENNLAKWGGHNSNSQSIPL
jgi:hypothetical protein